MIKNIFIPEKLGTKYIFPTRIVGFDVGKTHVTAAQLLLKGTSAAIEKMIDVPLEANSAPYEERASKAIAAILAQVDHYDQLHTSLASSVVIFKELKLPFLSPNKIRMVVNFEVEPLLPFATDDAVIDFIITKQNVAEKSSEILVTAVQKQYITQHLQLFAQAGVNPDLITVDAIALYNIYNLIPAYTTLSGGVVVLDLGAYSTTILYIQDKQLRLVRALPKGISHLAKTMSQSMQTTSQDAMEQILRFGLDKDGPTAYAQAARQVFGAFWQEIGFTLSSFTAQAEHHTIQQIVVLGSGTHIKGITTFASQQLGIKCEPFQLNKLLQQDHMPISTKNGLTNSYTISLGAALPTPITQSYNLRRKEFSLTTDKRLFTVQVIVSVALSCLLLVALIAASWWNLGSIQSSINQAEQEALTALKSQFKISPDQENLEEAVRLATTEVNREQKLWFSFANPARTPFLAYLLELTNRIDKESLGFVIDSIHLTENTLTLKAHVRDHKALAQLEKELKQSKLFAHIEKQNTPDFTMKIRL